MSNKQVNRVSFDYTLTSLFCDLKTTHHVSNWQLWGSTDAGRLLQSDHIQDAVKSTAVLTQLLLYSLLSSLSMRLLLYESYRNCLPISLCSWCSGRHEYVRRTGSWLESTAVVNLMREFKILRELKIRDRDCMGERIVNENKWYRIKERNESSVSFIDLSAVP